MERPSQLNVVDLGFLDMGHFYDAILVIQGRIELGVEPQNCIDDGCRIFSDLWKQWDEYHVANRGKMSCDCSREQSKF